jgi:hypothetical protein
MMAMDFGEKKREGGRWTNSKTGRPLRSDAYLGWRNRDKMGREPARYLAISPAIDLMALALPSHVKAWHGDRDAA